MKIFSFIPQNIQNRKLFSCFRKRLPELAHDTFELTSKEHITFNEIKLNAALKMYKTKFTPSDNDYGKLTYKTFILDKKKGTPVEVYFQQRIPNERNEEYYLFNPENMDVLGTCRLEFDKNKDLMEIAYMLSRGKDKYSGIGTRLYQLAFERKRMRNIKNIQIVSEPKAFFFHENAGFKPVKYIEVIDLEKYDKILSSFSRDYGISKENLKKLIIIRNNGDEILWDKYSSYENVIKYLKSHADEKTLNSSNLYVVMKPTASAVEEWEKLINANPILTGKDFPKGQM